MKCINASHITWIVKFPSNIKESKTGLLDSLVTNVQYSTIETYSNTYWEF